MNIMSAKVKELFEKFSYGYKAPISYSTKFGLVESHAQFIDEKTKVIVTVLPVGWFSTVVIIIEKNPESNQLAITVSERFESGNYGSGNFIAASRSMTINEEHFDSAFASSEQDSKRDNNITEMLVDIINNLHEVSKTVPKQEEAATTEEDLVPSDMEVEVEEPEVEEASLEEVKNEEVIAEQPE